LVLGWTLGFLRVPYLAPNELFGVGFGSALALVALYGLLFPAQRPSASPKSRTWAGVVLAAGAIIVGVTLLKWLTNLQGALNERDKKIETMAGLLEFGQKNNPEPLLRSVLEDIGQELKSRPARTLSDTMITRIAALSYAFPSAPFIEHDTLSTRKSNPGRGQLLQALLLMNIHPGSFAKIKQQTIFDEADLRNADLKGLDLSGIQLRGAQLEQANLTGTNLQQANLEAASLWGARLNEANLNQINLKKADLRWAQLNHANLSRADLTGANLQQAQLRNTDAHAAVVQWALVGGALFNEANLSGVDFVGTQFTQTNLSRANMTYTDLRKTSFSEADLVEVRFNKAVVDKNWAESLDKWRPTGAQALLKKYNITTDTTNKFGVPLYRLLPITD
jgi:uncharacterized protein YjbI with pentapeptide repeats